MSLRVALYLAYILLALAVAGAVDLADEQTHRKNHHVSTR